MSMVHLHLCFHAVLHLEKMRNMNVFQKDQDRNELKSNMSCCTSANENKIFISLCPSPSGKDQKHECAAQKEKAFLL